MTASDDGNTTIAEGLRKNAGSSAYPSWNSRLGVAPMSVYNTAFYDIAILRKPRPLKNRRGVSGSLPLACSASELQAA